MNKLASIFNFHEAYDCYNADLELLVQDEEESKAVFNDYKARFLHNRNDASRYQPIIKPEMDASE